MGLKDDIAASVKDAMRKKEKVRLGVLRMLMSEMKNRQIESQKELEEADILQVITRMVKQRHDSAEQFTKGGREELAAKEMSEIEVLQGYLPKALSENELEKLVKEAIAETQATSKKDMGKIMKVVMPKIAGRADGKAVNMMVARLLAS
ncbi:MAG: GatB/YqeY domain-containing protein [Pseudomonadota bacterium]|nr:GatB/YqeY domain-containing protein [Pseudomonadota bacterium]